MGYDKKPLLGTTGVAREPSVTPSTGSVWLRMSVGAPEEVRYVTVDTGGKLYVSLAAKRPSSLSK